MKTKNFKNSLIIFSAVVMLTVFKVIPVSANEKIEDQIVNYVNQERVKEGLEQLKENDILNEVAKLKAQDMLGNDYFAHTSPYGVNPWSWFDKAGYSYRYAGENLGMDFETAFSVHEAWMNSEKHRENIMSNKYQEIGVAVKRGLIDNKETQIAVQVFGKTLKEGESISEILEKESKEEVIEESGILITQSSIHFWKGKDEDEMLVSAEVQGNPGKVTVLIGTEEYDLEKLREDIYVNLISTTDIEIEENNVLIKAENKDEEAIFSKIPDKYFTEYLVERDDQSKDNKNHLVAMLNASDDDNFLNQVRIWFNQTGIMFLIVGLFIITIFNIWLLEKEEERLLELKG